MRFGKKPARIVATSVDVGVVATTVRPAGGERGSTSLTVPSNAEGPLALTAPGTIAGNVKS
jgi:hypothetical protein